MRFPEAEVKKLLQSQFDRIEALWEADPYQEILGWALVIKEYMRDHAIALVAEGIEAFKRFKAAQAEELSRLGFGARPALPATRLASQAA
jgi:hypothetical protein